jgi:hypothetical protein
MDRVPQPTGAAIRDLHPAAFVMATWIISASAASLGPSWLSRARLVLAAAGFVLRARHPAGHGGLPGGRGG